MLPLPRKAARNWLHLTTRCANLESVNHFSGILDVRGAIGTAVATRLLDTPSIGSRIEPHPNDQRDERGSARSLSLCCRGRAVNETRRTKIPAPPGMGSLASDPAGQAAGANRKRDIEVLLRPRGQAVSASGFPAEATRQVARHPLFVAERGARLGLKPAALGVATIKNAHRARSA